MANIKIASIRLIMLVIFLAGASIALASGAPSSPSDPASVGDPTRLIMMIVYAVVALGFSFLCSVAEAVVLSISPSFIAGLEQEGGKSAQLLKKVKGNIDRTLAAILTLNTIAHTVGAGGAGAEAAAYFGQKYVGLSMAILTLLILFLSEIIPKTIGAVYWRGLAISTARFVQILTWFLLPLIFISELLTKLLTKGKVSHVITREEFSALADIGAEHGHIAPKESRILKNLLRLPTVRAEDVMTPRTVVFALQQDRAVHEVLREHPDLGFSRIPIYGKDNDDITGFVLATDLLINETRDEGKAKLQDLKRELGAIRGDTSLSYLLEELLNGRQHIFLVVDEYGGMEGIVTLEDVVETLIGIEIVDEQDKNVDMRALAREKWKQRMENIGIDIKGQLDDSDSAAKKEDSKE